MPHKVSNKIIDTQRKKGRKKKDWERKREKEKKRKREERERKKERTIGSLSFLLLGSICIWLFFSERDNGKKN